MIIQPSSSDCPIVPDDRYEAVIVSTKHISLDTPDQYGKTEKLEIKVSFDVDGEEVTLDPRVNLAWSEKATLFKIAQAAGLDVNPFDPFDTDQLHGRRLRIDTEQEEGKWPRVTGWAKLAGRQKAKPAPAQCKEHDPVYKPDGTLVCLSCGVEITEPEDLPFEP